MRKIITYSLFMYLLLFTFACKTIPSEPAPNDLIDRDSMVYFLADRAIAEGIIHYTPAQQDQRQVAANVYLQLYEKYHLTQERVDASLQYYLSDKEMATTLMNDVDKRITEIKKATLGE